MGKPIPVIFNTTKNIFEKMGAGDGGMIVPGGEMTFTGNASYNTNAIYSYDSKGVQLSTNGVAIAKFEEIKAGMFSLTYRVMWNNNNVDMTTPFTNNDNLLKFTIYSVNSAGTRTNIATSVAKYSDFTSFNGSKYGSSFATVGMLFNYKNNNNEAENLFCEVSIPSTTAILVYVDYAILSSVLAGIYSLPVVQS